MPYDKRDESFMLGVALIALGIIVFVYTIAFFMKVIAPRLHAYF